jgi:pilus assembly protein Flp/PilA
MYGGADFLMLALVQLKAYLSTKPSRPPGSRSGLTIPEDQISSLGPPAAGGFAMFQCLEKFVCDESGATAIEYGLIASLIAVVIIAALSNVGNKLTITFTKVAGNLH